MQACGSEGGIDLIQKERRKSLIIFLVPAVLLFCTIYIYPSIRTVLMSFYETKTLTAGMGEWDFLGLENYKTLAGSTLFGQSMINMAKIWFFGGIITWIFSMLFALILTTHDIKGKRFFKTVIYMPNVISAVALGTMWCQYIYSGKYGLLKSVFTALGWEGLAKIQWTGSKYIFTAMLIAYCFGMVGYFMLTYIAAIERIPADIYEAATLAGAGKWQQLWHVTIPLIKPVNRTVFVLWAVRTVGFFTWTKVFSPQAAEMGTVTPMVYMYQNVFGSEVVGTFDIGAGAASSVLMTVMIVLMFAVSLLLFRDNDVDY